MPAGHVVTGQVLGPDGAPCVGARVSLYGAERERVTDDAGRFRLTKVAQRGWGMITVKAPGCVTARKQLRPGMTNVTVHLKRSARIEGRVLGPGGTPRADVLVRLMPRLRLRNAPRGRRMNLREVLATRTDDRGRYHFDGLPAGVTTIVAVPAADSLAPAACALEVLAGAVAQAPDLRVRRGVCVEGRVVDLEQRPVVGALVLISSMVSSAVAVTDAGGNFVLTGRTEDFNETISVTRAGYAPGHAYRRAQQTAPLRIRLRR